MALRMSICLPSGLPNRHDLLLLLLILHLATTMLDCMSLLTPGASVDSAGCMPLTGPACPMSNIPSV